jgi:hypothetical protein
MKTKHAHVGKAEKQLKRWGAQLDELAAKVAAAGTDIKADYLKHLEDLRLKHKAAQAKLDELKTASGEEWESFKAGLESAGNEVEVAFKKMTA